DPRRRGRAEGGSRCRRRRRGSRGVRPHRARRHAAEARRLRRRDAVADKVSGLDLLQRATRWRGWRRIRPIEEDAMTDTRAPHVVVVTGASAGVGRATVREFASRGARIGLIARGRAGLEGARRDVERAGGVALVLPLDVSDPAAVEAAAERVERELGPIDVWVNNAMLSV